MTAYAGKLFIHPVPIGSIEDLWARATIGPVSGQLILLAGLLFHASWIIIAIVTLYSRRGAGRARGGVSDKVLELATGRNLA